jgi:hypothetical protein
MWNEIRADRTLVETMAEITPCGPGRSHGTDLRDPEHARSMTTAIRYMSAAGMASQRAQRAFVAHRKAKQAGLILPAEEPAEVANQNDTSEFPDRAAAGPPAPSLPLHTAANGTNEFPASNPVSACAAAATADCTNDLWRADRPAGLAAAQPIAGRSSRAWSLPLAATGG